MTYGQIIANPEPKVSYRALMKKIETIVESATTEESTLEAICDLFVLHEQTNDRELCNVVWKAYTEMTQRYMTI